MSANIMNKGNISNQIKFLIIFLVFGVIFCSSSAFADSKDNGIAITISVDREVCNPGDTGRAYLSLVNSGSNVYGDFYLVLLDPEEHTFFYPLWTDEVRSIRVSIADGFTLPQTLFAEFTMPNINPPMQKPGIYTFAAVLAYPGTFDFIAAGSSPFTMNSAPDTPYTPIGASRGWVDTPYTFWTLSNDESRDMVSIRFDWGDGVTSDWSEFVYSGDTISMVYSFDTPGTYDIRAQAQDAWGVKSEWSSPHRIAIINNYSPETPKVDGPSEGQVLREYFFLVSSEDKDGDKISFKVEWGDGSSDGWSEPVESGAVMAFAHIWGEVNTYQIAVHARDTNDAEGIPAKISMIIHENRAPYFTHGPSGPPKGQRNINYSFATTAVDPDGDDVSYKFYWDDGQISDWSEFQESGKEFIASHSYNGIKEYRIRAYARDTEGNVSGESAWHVFETSANRLPNFNGHPPLGPTSGRVGIQYDFTTTGYDPEGSNVQLKFFWGDGSETEWSPPVKSGIAFTASHAYHEAGEYRIYAIAKDNAGIYSLSSPSLLIKIYGPANEPPFFTDLYSSQDTATVGAPITFYTSATDPEGEMIQYKFYWTSDVSTDWTEFLPSGVYVNRSHAWSEVGNYGVVVWAKDEKGNLAQSNSYEVKVNAE